MTSQVTWIETTEWSRSSSSLSFIITIIIITIIIIIIIIISLQRVTFLGSGQLCIFSITLIDISYNSLWLLYFYIFLNSCQALLVILMLKGVILSA